MSEPEKLVYKYCDPGGLAILTSRTIRLTRPRAFNDPFDLRPHYATTVYAQVGDGRAVALPDMQVVDHETALKIRPSVVLSLSASPASLLMWAHYAAGHTGLAIGFQPGSDILAGSSPHRRFGRVTYAAERPSKPTAMELSDEEVWLTKSCQWEHEDEWRLIDSLYSADENGPVDPDGNRWLFRVRPERVGEVILGCRAENALWADTMNVLRCSDFVHVRLMRADVDDRRYRINLVEVPRDEWPAAVAG